MQNNTELERERGRDRERNVLRRGKRKE